MEVELNIVGLKYRNIDRLRLKKIVENPITLVKEPTNKFDKFAVQCWSDGQTHYKQEYKNGVKVSD